MIIFGRITGAIIAVNTNLQGFCLKCDQITGITDEVYKPISRKVLIEKAKCKRCSRIQRNYRKFVAFSSENYQELAHFGKARIYSKMRWTTLAPEVDSLHGIRPSQVRTMYLTSGIKNVISKKRKQVAIGNNNVQIGGNATVGQRPHPSQLPYRPFRWRPESPAQQNPYQPRVNRMNPYGQQNYHYPSCRCNHCLDLDRERRRIYGEHNA
jgi:hypothetical protein